MCENQHICVTVFKPLSIISVRFNVIINNSIGVPGHYKDIVDGLNAGEKKYIKKAIFCIVCPEKNTKKIT